MQGTPHLHVHVPQWFTLLKTGMMFVSPLWTPSLTKQFTALWLKSRLKCSREVHAVSQPVAGYITSRGPPSLTLYRQYRQVTTDFLGAAIHTMCGQNLFTRSLLKSGALDTHCFLQFTRDFMAIVRSTLTMAVKDVRPKCVQDSYQYQYGERKGEVL